MENREIQIGQIKGAKSRSGRSRERNPDRSDQGNEIRQQDFLVKNWRELFDLVNTPFLTRIRSGIWDFGDQLGGCAGQPQMSPTSRPKIRDCMLALDQNSVKK